MKPRAVGAESDLDDVEAVQTGPAALEHPVHRLAREQADFNGAKDLLLVAGVNPRRRRRVQAPEQAVEKLAAILSALAASAAPIDAPSVALGHRLKARAQAFRPPRAFKQAQQESSQVKAGTTRQNRQTSPIPDGLKHP